MTSQALQTTVDTLNAIVRSAADAIVTADSEGIIVTWNPAAEGMFGYAEDEVVGQPLSGLVPERFRSAHEAGIARVVDTGETKIIGSTVEVFGLHEDGHEFPIALNDKNDQLEALSGKFAKYLSRQVYDSIFEGRTDVQVQSYRKELTVFFSDIQGFTELTDRLEAEVISDILNSYLSEMATIADACGGTIDKFIGDGIMIFFGDPDSMGKKKDALGCVRMAIQMRSRAGELRQDFAEVIGPEPLHIRMGINTGYCTVGNFGSEDRLDYTIVGGAVNAASRLESTAEPDQIQISHSTYSLIKDAIYCRPIGDVKVKGLSHELRTYEVVGAFDDLGPKERIKAEIGDFNLSLDPTSLDSEATERAREALQSALAALEERPG